MVRKMWPAVVFLLVMMVCIVSARTDYLMGGHMDNSEPSKSLLKEMESPLSLARTANLDDLDLDLDAEESTVVSASASDGEGPRYRLPYSFAFNGGRPFSLEKDPITGKIDFEKAPPVKALNYTERYQENDEKSEDQSDDQSQSQEGNTTHLAKKIESKETEDVSPNEINPYSPNFHDFLNLPVHYSSDKYDKDKYPLISSSYANTKVQSGSNSYSTYNHRPYHGETVLYYPTRKPYVPKASVTVATTRLVNVKTTSTTRAPSTSTTTATPSTTTTTTRMPTTTTTTSTTTPRPTTAPSTKAPVITTWKPPVTSNIRYTEHTNDYEDILPIEKLQSSVYANSNQANNVVQNQESQANPLNKNEEYSDTYEEYEMGEDEEDKDYYPMKETTKEMTRTTTMTPITSTISFSSSEPTMPPTTTIMTTQSTKYASPLSQENVFISNPIPFQVVSQRPVTSMPLDNRDHLDPQLFESLDNRRNNLPNGPLMNVAYRPTQVMHQRPGVPNGGILLESTSNIIIPPDQDTVSFVLGNRQNVEGGYYSVGTAIGENPYNQPPRPSGLDASFRPLYGSILGSGDVMGNHDPMPGHRGTVAMPSVTIVDTNSNPSAEKWGAPPPTQKLVNEIETARPQPPVVKGTVQFEQQDDRKEEKDPNYVVFPSGEENKQPVEEHVVIINEADGSIHEIPPSTPAIHAGVEASVSGNKVLPQLSENLTPPAERPRPPPPFYYHYHHGGTLRPDYPRPQRVPLPPPRGKPQPPPSLPAPPEPAGMRRRPYTPDANLPNILPQFRPNAKTSHGHRGSETIGTIPAGQTFPSRVRPPLQPPHPPRRPMLPPPSYLQRLNPPPPPIHALRLAAPISVKSDSMVLSREPEAGIKRLRIPPVGATSRGEDDAKSAQGNRTPTQKLHLDEEDRTDRYSEEPPAIPPRPPLFPKRRTADSPHIATLQMIQQHGELDSDPAEQGLPIVSTSLDEESDGIRTVQEIDRRKLDNADSLADPPVYVVYPVNTAVNIHPDDSSEKDESVVVGTRGPHRPLPPETLLQDSGEHETLENESAPVHNLYNSRPPVASDFPYPLERPDASIFGTGVRETPLLVPSDQRQDNGIISVQDRNQEKEETDTSINIIPYLQDFVPFPPRKNEAAISATLQRLPAPSSSTPIAYAYTPTAQASHRLDVDIHDEKISRKPDRNDQKPILLPSQQPSSSSSSAPSPQNFMAPFVASLSAEAPSKNGWSVVAVEHSIDRKSDDVRDSSEDSFENDESQTEKEFDADNFKPQLFGGFKPIYEFPTDDMDRAEPREASDIKEEMLSRPGQTDSVNV